MLRPVDLAGERMIVAPAGSPHRSMLTQLFRANGVELEVAVEATGWELMLQFAKYEVGIAVVNDFCVVPKPLVSVRLATAPDVRYWLLGRTGFSSRASEALRNLIVETVQARQTRTTNPIERSDNRR